MECIFCNIAEQESQAEIVFEDENIIAFLDIRPVNFGHTLVVPRKHFDNFLTIPREELSQLINATQYIAGAVKRSMNADGFNIVSNNGESAGQTVFHCHVHLIPRRHGDVPSPRGGVRGVIPQKQSY